MKKIVICVLTIPALLTGCHALNTNTVKQIVERTVQERCTGHCEQVTELPLSTCETLCEEWGQMIFDELEAYKKTLKTNE